MSEYTPRRKRLDLSRFDTMQMHTRPPLMTVWWAASFAGFGQMMLGSYVKGYFLVILQIIINIQAHLNSAIFYSFTGQFELAKSVLDLRWLLLYVSVYCYGLWDSYNLTISMNSQAVLASREKAPIDVFKMMPFSINFLDKRTPWVSIFWSIMMPGFGHMYNLRMVTGYFLILFTLVTSYFSRMLEGIHFTFTGDFSQAIAVLDPQWLLFFPSIYLYAAHEAYSSAVELNKIFDIEQREFLQKRYQELVLELPILKTERSAEVLLTATFDHSTFVELAVTELEDRGIEKEKILAIPLVQPNDNDFAMLDTIHRADGVSIIDTGAVFGTIGMTFGTIYGFVLTWGPLIWAMLGLLIGVSAGLALDYLLTMRKLGIHRKDKITELVLIVSCDKTQTEMVEKVLRANTALGVGIATA